MPFVRKTTHSIDGTKIAYYQIGSGPGIILIHGAMQHALSHSDLATSLSDYFTCFLPDRRGRGQSGPTGKDYSTRKEAEDVEAIHVATGARFIFGVSSGAVVTLNVALAAPSSHIEKIATFEPPWWPESEREQTTAWTERYEAEVSRGQLAEAATTALLGTQMGPSLFQSKYFPRSILVFLTRTLMRFDKPVALPDSEKSDDSSRPGAPLFKDLIPTFRNDIKIAMEVFGEENLRVFSAIQAPALILGGSQSPAFLKQSVRELEQILPNSKRVELEGLDHAATGNKQQRGSPEVVARELKRFFLGEDKINVSNGH